MKNTRILALLLVAAAGTQCLTGCGEKKKSSMPLYAETAVETPTDPPVGGSDISGDNYNPDEYFARISSHVEGIQVTDGELVLGTVGDSLISPEEGAADYNLGDYRLSSSGIKLYYDETEYPTELMLTLEKYFTSFPAADYNVYYKCLFPGYIPEMEAKNADVEGYSLKNSFIKRCASLANISRGDFKITRIKVEKTAPREDGQDNVQAYFEGLNNYLGKDYYSEVKEQCDNLVDACFYIMGENSYGQETMIVQNTDIVFAVKDGKYYTFG